VRQPAPSSSHYRRVHLYPLPLVKLIKKPAPVLSCSRFEVFITTPRLHIKLCGSGNYGAEMAIALSVSTFKFTSLWKRSSCRSISALANSRPFVAAPQFEWPVEWRGTGWASTAPSASPARSTGADTVVVFAGFKLGRRCWWFARSARFLRIWRLADFLAGEGGSNGSMLKCERGHINHRVSYCTSRRKHLSGHGPR
jgi:hypothetical protein